jgi:pimeloyl-ACP methyl ester carboxylesterase
LAALAAPVDAQGPSAELVVQVGANTIGSAESSVQRTDTGWIVSGSGRLRPPIDLVTRRVEVRYDSAWRPQELQIDGITQGGVLTIRTTFSSTEAHNDITRLTDRSTKVDKVSADTLVLPNLFFPTYEALALRLGALEGDAATLPVYVAPQAEILMHVKRLPPEIIETGDAAIQARRFSLTFMNPGSPLEAELWIDENSRLLRFVAPAQQLAVTRADVARVNVRLQTISRPGDQTIRVPANGFSIVGTLSEPTGTPPPRGRWPAIIMVPGSGAVDRDETVAGIPIFGQLAGAFADAGFLVVRYDKRGIGQSGGRAESAGLEDYAADLRAVVKEVADRKDVDSKRIAVFGHSEGAWVALLAAARDDRIAALVLAGAPSGRGADLVLEQQAYLLGRMSLSDPEKQTRMDLQKRIQAAVLGEGEWDGVPSELRRQADTPWFRSFLGFSPASIMKKVDQPMLLVHGERDRTVAVHHVDRLLELAQARRKDSKDVADAVKLPLVNHLLVEAETGDLEEYPKLAGKRVSPDLAATVIAWLGKTMGQGE